MKQLNWMKVRQTVIASVSLAALAFGGTASATTYWVATDGDDTASGDAEHPVKTVSKGISKATEEGDEVVVRPGHYSLSRVSFAANHVTLRSSTGDPNDVWVDNKAAHIQDNASGGKTHITVSGITFANGRYNSPDRGSSIYFAANPCYAVISNCVFRDASQDTTYSYGGAVAVCGHAEFVDCLFTNNVGRRAGGAIYADCSSTSYASNEDGMVYLTRCKFYDNIITNGNATHTGGAVSLNSPDAKMWGLVLKDCEFARNISAHGNGGAVCGKIFRAEGCVFSDNVAHTLGGAVYYGSRSITSNWTNRFYACSFTRNLADTNSYGGAVSSPGGCSSVFSNCTFTANVAGYGAAFGSDPDGIYRSRTHQFYGCQFRANVSAKRYHTYSGHDWPSSVLRLVTYSGIVEDCLFESNVAAGGCYGIDLYTSSGSVENRFCNNTFVGNRTLPLAEGETALPPGGAIVIPGVCTNTVVRNCLIVSNVNAQAAAQLTVQQTTLKPSRIFIDNCTIADNAAVDGANGYGLYAHYRWNQGQYAGSVRNCIITGNHCATNAALPCLDVPNEYDANTKGYNLFLNCLVGNPGYDFPDGQNGCRVGVAPKFVGDGKTPYALKKSSPACGLGDALDWMNAETTDLIGHARLRGDLVDAGCYSYFPAIGLMLILR